MAKKEKDLREKAIDVSQKIELCAQLRLIANWAGGKLDQQKNEEMAGHFAAVWIEAEDDYADARAALKVALDRLEEGSKNFHVK